MGDGLVRLEGFHAVKHALRFGATLTSLATPDGPAVEALRAELAPDLDLVGAGLTEVDGAAWAALAPRGLPSPLLATAVRPAWSPADLSGHRPLVLLEDPRHLGNLGAVVRVAAAADAAGVVAIGDVDVWHPTVVRAAAGLHWALPVLGVATLTEAIDVAAAADRRLVALDERGEELPSTRLGHGPALLLGSERHGLSDAARSAADAVVRIPMRAGVSSLNLAAAAAVALYST